MDTPVDFFKLAQSTTTRRVIKTNLPVNLLAKKMLALSDHKIIYTVRNPKDTAVSFFHFIQNVYGYVGSLTDLFDNYLKGDVLYGSYFCHFEEILRLAKITDNLLVITYEEMVTNMIQVIKQITDFLKIPLSESDIQRVVDYLHFDQIEGAPVQQLSLF